MKLHGRMSIRTAEKRLTDWLHVPGVEVVIRDVDSHRDIRDDANINALRCRKRWQSLQRSPKQILRRYPSELVDEKPLLTGGDQS